MKKKAILNKILKEIEEFDSKAALLAVSKNHTYKEIEEAFNCGQKIFGENRVQEILAKFPKNLPLGMKIHLIGHLQTNKVSKIVGKVDMIESVDSLKLAIKIDKECEKIGKIMPILLEINTSGEESKTGFVEQQFFKDIRNIVELKNIDIKGFMTIGPISDEENKIRNSFRQLKKIQKKCQNMFPEKSFSMLSMGMSSDYKIALDEGSTEIRIGTAIFGKRVYA